MSTWYISAHQGTMYISHNQPCTSLFINQPCISLLTTNPVYLCSPSILYISHNQPGTSLLVRRLAVRVPLCHCESLEAVGLLTTLQLIMYSFQPDIGALRHLLWAVTIPHVSRDVAWCELWRRRLWTVTSTLVRYDVDCALSVHTTSARNRNANAWSQPDDTNIGPL